MAPFLPVRATSRSQAVRIGKQSVKTGTTTYVDVGSQTETAGIKAGSTLPFSPFKELQNHLAIGSVVVVGPLTASNTQSVIFSGAAVTKAKGGAGEETEVKIAAGELQNRNTGAYVTVAGANVLLTEVAAAKERIDIIYVDEATGALEKTAGTPALVAAAVQPALPAKKLLVATLKSTNKNTTNVLTLVTSRP